MEDNKICFKVQEEESEGVYSNKTYRFDKIMNIVIKYISNVFGIMPKEKNRPGLNDQILGINQEIKEIRDILTKLDSRLNNLEPISDKLVSLEGKVSSINGKISSIQLGEENGYKDCVKIFIQLNEAINKHLAIWKDRELINLIYKYVYIHNDEQKKGIFDHIKDKDQDTINSVNNRIRDIDNFYKNYLNVINEFLHKIGEKEFIECIINPCDRTFCPELHDEANYTITDTRPESKKSFLYVLKLGYDFPRFGKNKALVYTDSNHNK